MRGYGYEPLFISIADEDDHADVHARFAGLLDEALDESRRSNGAHASTV